MRNEDKVYIAFITAPFIPAVFIYLYFTLAVPNADTYGRWYLNTYLFVSLFVGYLIVFIVMIPTYLIFQKLNIKKIIPYVAIGAIGGAIGFYIATRGVTLIQGYVIPVTWGVLSASIFWFIVRPDKKHITHMSRSRVNRHK